MNTISKTLLTITPVSLLAFFPVIASAQGFSDTLTDIQDLVNSLIPLVATVALLAFFWGLAKYVFQADDEEAQAQGKRIMIGGIVALFLIAAIGGIISFLTGELGLDSGATIDTSGIDTDSN